MAILIKRYANRKLYNTQTSRYITLKGIAELLDEGSEVRVIDNESGEDITSVALSQILVDRERGGDEVPKGLLANLMERGGDALYGALRQGIHDASEGIGDIQSRVRQIIPNPGPDTREDRGEGTGSEARDDSGRFAEWIAYASPDFDAMVQRAVERVFRVLDLPRRSDIDALNTHLERVAKAVERLEGAVASGAAQGRQGSDDSRPS